MLKVFFDTEFTGLHQNTTLISIGLVSERGDTFYAEFSDYDKAQCDEWINTNVISKLKFSVPKYGEDEFFIWTGGEDAVKKVELRGNTQQIAQYLYDWFQDILGGPLSWVDYGEGICPPEITDPSIELWSDCLAYDFVLFNQLWEHAFNIPKCIYYIPFDICTLFKVVNVDPDIDREAFVGCSSKNNKHNALWDAKIIKKCHDKLIRDYYLL